MNVPFKHGGLFEGATIRACPGRAMFLFADSMATARARQKGGNIAQSGQARRWRIGSQIFLQTNMAQRGQAPVVAEIYEFFKAAQSVRSYKH